MIIHNLEQGSLEWHRVRAGKLTASDAQAIGNNGKGLESLVIETMARFYSSAPADSYTNANIERGNELEPQAASMYELQTGLITSKVGFVEFDEYVGCSPDRFVGEDGQLEIKCPSDVTFLKLMLAGKEGVDTAHIWQMQMQMLVTGRKWTDYLAYNPNFSKSLLIHRFEPDTLKFEALKRGFEIGKIKIQAIKNQIEQ